MPIIEEQIAKLVGFTSVYRFSKMQRILSAFYPPTINWFIPSRLSGRIYEIIRLIKRFQEAGLTISRSRSSADDKVKKKKKGYVAQYERLFF